MGEKRYQWYIDGVDIWDNQKEERIDDTPTLLNELSKENEQLKKENNILKASNGEYEDALARLEEENEQLKQENEWLKSEIQKLYNFVKIDVDRNIEVYPKSLMEPILEILKIIGDVE